LKSVFEELNFARNRIVELNDRFVTETDKKFNLLQESRKRRTEDAESAQELLKSLNIDLLKIAGYDQADEKRSQAYLDQVKMNLKAVPKENLSKAQDQMLMGEIIAGQSISNPLYKRFFISTAIAGLEHVLRSHWSRCHSTSR
jgi:hypothetical protein